MPYYTPLRYPGGKRRLVSVVARLLETNGMRDIDYAEPYAGGAAIALALLFEEHAATIHINDLSRPVFAFWHTVLNHNRELCQRIRAVDVSMDEWTRQREVYEGWERADLADLGFAALFLNRTNRSGIIGGGVIGGREQTGAWALDARFTKDNLIHRVRRIGRYRSRVMLYQLDAEKFVRTVVPGLSSRAFTFYDPPYIENSENLYLNTYDLEGHRRLAKTIQRTKQPWVVTYDAAAIREGLYPGRRRLVYGLSYSAQDRYRGTEVMFLSDGLQLPREWSLSSRFSLSAESSRHPVYARMETVKPQPDFEEGPAAFERFRRAVKTIIATPKDTVASRAKPPAKKKRKARKTSN